MQQSALPINKIKTPDLPTTKVLQATANINTSKTLPKLQATFNEPSKENQKEKNFTEQRQSSSDEIQIQKIANVFHRCSQNTGILSCFF